MSVAFKTLTAKEAAYMMGLCNDGIPFLSAAFVGLGFLALSMVAAVMLCYLLRRILRQSWNKAIIFIACALPYFLSLEITSCGGYLPIGAAVIAWIAISIALAFGIPAYRATRVRWEGKEPKARSSEKRKAFAYLIALTAAIWLFNFSSFGIYGPASKLAYPYAAIPLSPNSATASGN